MEISLSGKVALVTGAAQGIGKAIAVALAGSGADVAVNDKDDRVVTLADDIKRLGNRAEAAIFNVADRNAAINGIDRIREKLGPVDILVNNAGITDNLSSVSKIKKEKWDWELGVNLGGAFNCTGAVLPGMVQSGWGRIIMISSLGALGIYRQACYAASKAGLSGLARTIAIENAKNGITCNTIMCGLIGSPKVLALPEEVIKLRTRLIPAGKIGTIEDVAGLVVFLSSQYADYITGEEICVDGGAHIPAISYGARELGYTP